MKKPEQRESVDDEVKKAYKTFRTRTNTSKALYVLGFAASWIPGVKEKVWDASIEAAKVAGHVAIEGSVAAVDIIA